MTLTRRVTVRISGMVVRHASPGCKEWAEGLAREIEFIEGDWAALRWALGSMRVLLERRSAPTESRDDAGPSLPSFVDWSWWCVSAWQVWLLCLDVLHATGWQDRVGWGLVAFSWAYQTVGSIRDWFRERWAPPPRDLVATRLFLKEGLERRLARFRSVRRWFPVLVTVGGCSGFLMIAAGAGRLRPVLDGAVIAVGAFFVWLQCLDSPSKIQGRIERLNALMAAEPGPLDRWSRFILNQEGD